MKMKLHDYLNNSNGAFGLAFEYAVCKEHNLKKSKHSTAKWDAMTKHGDPVSIKYVKREDGRDIVFSDLFRQANVRENFYLIIGFWSEDPSVVDEIYVLYISGAYWNSLFNMTLVSDLRKMLDKNTLQKANKVSSEERSADWIPEYKRISDEWLVNNKLMKPRAKLIDPMNIKGRVQCAMTLSDFFGTFLESRFVMIKKKYTPSKRGYNHHMSLYAVKSMIKRYCKMVDGKHIIKDEYKGELCNETLKLMQAGYKLVIEEIRDELKKSKLK